MKILFKEELSLLDDQLKKNYRATFLISFISIIFQLFAAFSIYPFINMSLNLNASSLFERFLIWIGIIVPNGKPILVLGIIVVLLQLVSTSLNAYAVFRKNSFILELNSKFSMKILDHYLKVPYSYFSDQNSGVLSKNIINDPQQISSLLFSSILDIYVHGVLIILFVTALIWINPVITLIFILYLGIILGFLINFTRNYLNALGRSINYENQTRFKKVNEILNNMKLIRIHSSERYFYQDYRLISDHFIRKTKIAQLVAELPRHIVEAVTFSSIIILILIYSEFFGNTSDLIPLLSVYLLALYRILPSFYKVNYAFSNVHVSQNIPTEVLTTMSDQPYSKQGTLEKSYFRKEICLKEVSFTYRTRDLPALKNINISINHNEFIGIVGSSGSGKSSLIDILLNLYEPDEGGVYMDDHNIKDLDPRSYKSIYGYVPQDVYIFDGTIVENIAFGIDKEKADIERVKSILTQLSLLEFVETQLPLGIETLIGEKGIQLSGGQKQRIGIARALYHEPEIMVLDESTNALDEKTEKQIIEDLSQNFKGKKTIILITHKSNLLRYCDKVLQLESGELVFYGSSKEYSKQYKTVALD